MTLTKLYLEKTKCWANLSIDDNLLSIRLVWDLSLDFFMFFTIDYIIIYISIILTLDLDMLSIDYY